MDRKLREFLCLSPAGYALTCSVAALLGWVVGEPFFQEGGDAARVVPANAFLCPAVLGLIAAALVFIDSVSRKSAVESIILGVSGFGVVFAATFFIMIPAQVVFSWFSSAAHAASGFDRGIGFISILAGRSISWCLFSAGVVTLLIVNKEAGTFMAVITGTLVSGAISGLLFDPIQLVLLGHGIELPWVSRVICFLVFGGLIGLFFGIAKGLSRDGQLLITSGELAGSVLVLDSAPCLIGPSRKCDLTVRSRGMKDFAAVVQKTGFGFRFYVLDEGSAFSVNNRKIRISALRAGDRVRIGEVDMIFSNGS
ncbi:MAG: FHA domain-containing protein [Desulfomonile tiedjei]|uniref:FHA domain-containing protein n=1 Tax=Desulfomonile tiedjei TaxID=2358 RepID=A0A9D6V4V5_9BACT|nr:FHA domain-containing protein [Desulfomonile tiedjei]